LKNRPPVPPLPSVSDHDENNPPRSSSTAPYPLTDEPTRSASAAPYPLTDGPSHGRVSGPPGGFFNPNGQGGPPGGRGQPSPSLSGFHFNSGDGPPPRPATTTNDPRGRSPVGQQRYPSGPPGFPGGRPDMGYNGPPGQRANSLSPHHGPQPMGDIGFVAPLQPRRGTPNHSPGQSPVYGAQSGQAPGPRPPRGQAMQPGMGGRNPRPGGGPEPPQKMAQGRPGQQQGPGRPGAGPAGQRPGAGRKPAKPANPMGSGPKTFEEMGIAAQKQEGECVSCPIWSDDSLRLTCCRLLCEHFGFATISDCRFALVKRVRWI
jgi:hypothetical protein